MIKFLRKGVALAVLIAMVLSAAGCKPSINNDKSSSGGNSSAISGNSSNTEASEGDESGNVTEGSDPSSSTDESGDVTGQNTSKTGGGTAATTTKKNTSGGGYKEPIYDLKGRVIVIASEEAPPDMSKVRIFNESIKLTEEKYNCKFKFVQQSDYQALYQSLINDHAAGTATYDVVNLRGYDVLPNAVNSGAILDVSQYYDFDNDPTWQEDIFKTIGTFKGKRYGIPYSPNELGNGIWYNRALLRKFNVPDLWTYVDSNQWNWTTFRAVCKKLTQDTSGDGKPDYWAFTSTDPWLDFIYANNGALVTSGVGGAPKFSLDSKNALEAIQFVADLHMVDNTVPDGKELGAITDKPFNALFTGKVAMATYHARYGAVMEQMGIASADIGWVYFPMGPAAKTYVTPTGTMPDMYVMPRAVSNPKEVVAAVQDLAAYWDTSRKVQRKISDKTEELYGALKSSLDSNAKKVLLYQAKNPVFTMSNNYNLSHTLQNELWPMILKGKSVKTSVDSVKSKLQTELTTKYNGTIVGK